MSRPSPLGFVLLSRGGPLVFPSPVRSDELPFPPPPAADLRALCGKLLRRLRCHPLLAALAPREEDLARHAALGEASVFTRRALAETLEAMREVSARARL